MPDDNPWWVPRWMKSAFDNGPFRFSPAGGVIPGYQAPNMRSPNIEQEPWFNPYGPSPADPYFLRWQQNVGSYTPPPPATATPPSPSTAPDQPASNIGDPAWYLRTGSPNVPATNNGGGNNQVPDDYVPQWNPWQDPVFEWKRDMSGLAGTFREGIDPTDFDYYDQNFVWDEDVYGKKEDWTSSYHPLYYQNKSAEPLNWLAGSSNGGNMGSRGWRRPGRYAERPPKPPRRGETPNPEGNNKNLTIPSWVGSLVSWRT